MRLAGSALLLALVTLQGRGQLTPSPDTTGAGLALFQSRQAAEELLSRVRSVLLRELTAGGPVRAIVACADTAPELSKRVQRERGIAIRRISNRWRNPNDIPDSYEMDVLVLWDSLHAAGSFGEKEEHTTVVEETTGTVFRYMKPIFVQGMCITCHGERAEMKNLIATVIQDRYPADRATGYRPGDLRGAVSVRVPLRRP
jgi:hypothetical protein